MVYPTMNEMFDIIENFSPCNKTVEDLCSTNHFSPDPNHYHKMLRISKTVAGIKEHDNELDTILHSYGWNYEDVENEKEYLLNYVRTQYLIVIEKYIQQLETSIKNGKISLNTIISLINENL